MIASNAPSGSAVGLFPALLAKRPGESARGNVAQSTTLARADSGALGPRTGAVVAGLEGRAEQGRGPEDEALEEGGAIEVKVVRLLRVEGKLAGVASLGMQQDGDTLRDHGVGGAMGEQQAARADGGDRVTGAGVWREAGDSSDERTFRARRDGDRSAEVPADEGHTLDALAPEGVERAEQVVAAIGEGAVGVVAQLGDSGDTLERGSKLRVEAGGASEGAITSGKEEHGGMVAAGGAPEAVNRAARCGDGQGNSGERCAITGVGGIHVVGELKRAGGFRH